LFLDEIGELPFRLQVKLLRVLQEREITPLGSSKSLKIDVRIISATNRDLLKEIGKKNFRKDLYYRLVVIKIHAPPLRKLRSDIPILAKFFLDRYNKRFAKNVSPPSSDIEMKLMAYDWPGNVRELQNAIERGVVLSTDGKLHIEDILEPPPSTSVGTQQTEGFSGSSSIAPINKPLSEAKHSFERLYLQQLLEATRGNISEMARISGRYRADIYRLLSKYGIEWEDFR